MTLSTPVIRQTTALIIGIFGGVIAHFAGLPLPWMIGPMIATTIAAMLRAPVSGPQRIRPIVIPILGVMLGSAMTPALFGMLGNWVVTLMLLPVFLICAAGASYAVYRRIGGYDPVTAYFCAMPGGLNDMIILGGEAGGDERRIGLAHAARVLMVIVFVALFFGAVFGVSSNGQGAARWIGLGDITLRDYVVLGLCAVLGAWIARRLGLPAAPIFGPMILSGATHIAGLVTVAPPTLFVIAAQITIGTVIGTRFVGTTVAELRRDIGLSVISSFLMLMIAVTFAEAIVLLTAIPHTQAFLAFSPGGLNEMALLAIAMDEDPAYVSLIHIIRITLVIAAAPLVFGAVRRRF